MQPSGARNLWDKEAPDSVRHDPFVDQWTASCPNAASRVAARLEERRIFGVLYYPFRSEKEANAKPTMWQWMDAHAGRSIIVHEFPTEDRLPIAAEQLEAVTEAVKSLVAAGAVVVVMDSAGSQRTGAVCDALGSSFMRRLTPPCR